MTDFTPITTNMAVLTVLFIPSLSIISKSSKNSLLYVAFILHILFVAPILASHEKNVAIELQKIDKTTFKKLTAGGQSSETDAAAARVYGKQTNLGGDKKAEGRIHLVYIANCIW